MDVEIESLHDWENVELWDYESWSHDEYIRSQMYERFQELVEEKISELREQLETE